MVLEKNTDNLSPNSPVLEETPLTRKDLREQNRELRESLLKDMAALVADLLKPVQASLTDLVKEVKDATKIAETASEMALNLQGDVRSLQITEQSSLNRTAILENKWRQLNLKFHGFEEGAEENKDPVSFIAAWLANILELEDGIAPVIIKVQRLGPLAAVRREGPRLEAHHGPSDSLDTPNSNMTLGIEILSKNAVWRHRSTFDMYVVMEILNPGSIGVDGSMSANSGKETQSGREAPVNSFENIEVRQSVQSTRTSPHDLKRFNPEAPWSRGDQKAVDCKPMVSRKGSS
ncbi:UNVERIFIED_CONTAM: hypothetical protein K2H54_060751 [Gekko kuhli]